MAALAKLLADNPGPVSIADGITALRAIGAGVGVDRRQRAAIEFLFAFFAQ